MAIYRHKTQDVTDEDGREWLQVSDELEEVPCYLCDGEARRQVCPGDGRYHHHGCIHLPEGAGGLGAVCDECYPIVEAEWALARA